jgi:predicted aspartyl protease
MTHPLRFITTLIITTASASFVRGIGAQSAPAPSAPAKPASVSLSCPVRTKPLNEADIAYAHDTFDQAADLYRKDSALPGAEGDRAHNGLIRALLSGGKVTDAESDAKAWVAAAPQSSWAMASLGEVQYREARMDDTIASIQAAGRLDRCNMQVHVDFARFSELSGMNATAKRHLDVAHTYEPLNDEIEKLWLRLQPRSVQLQELTNYLDRSSFLNADERVQLGKWKESLEHPPEPCRLSSPVDSATIPYQAIRPGPNREVEWGLMVAFNGKQRRLEIDTGASGLVLSRSAAASLHLTPEFQGSAGGVGDQGKVRAYAAKVDSIKIGNLEFQHCYVTVLEKDVGVLETSDGLIGGDVFRDFLLTLDFPGRKLILDPLPPVPGATVADAPSLATQEGDAAVQDAYIAPRMQNWTVVYRRGHDLLIPVSVNAKHPRLFLVDTGALLTSITPQAAREDGKLFKASDVEVQGISGKVDKTYSTGELILSFAGLRYPVQSLTAFDTGFSDQSGVEVSGFLGAAILRRLTMRIDYRDDLINFTYDPKRVTPCMKDIYREDCY